MVRRPLAPLSLLRPDLLGASYWPIAVLASIAATHLLVFQVFADRIPRVFHAALVVAVSISMSIITTGLYMEFRREAVIAGFKPDEIRRSSFFRSIREAPRDFQLFLHAAALKGCRPYAWSYGKMDFYVLPQNVAPNVLDRDWIDKCQLRRSDD